MQADRMRGLMRQKPFQRKGIILRFSLSDNQRGENTIRISVILKYEFAESIDIEG